MAYAAGPAAISHCRCRAWVIPGQGNPNFLLLPMVSNAATSPLLPPLRLPDLAALPRSVLHGMRSAGDPMNYEARCDLT